MKLTKADIIFNKKMAYIANALGDTAKSVQKYQTDLLNLLLAEYLPLFELKDGVIVSSTANDGLINKIDNYFNKLEKAMYRDVLGPFSKKLLESASLSAEYYVNLGFKKKVVDGILNNKVALERKLGITPTGRLRKGSYLYELGKTNQVRQELKDFVLTNLTGDTAYLDFQLGLRNLVKGNKRVKGLDTNGKLHRYFDQYAYDSFNSLDATANKQFAQNLGLEHFVYEGDIIDTTRAFCYKKAGKAFTVAESKLWVNDPDLIDKKTKDAYIPLVHRGRYRCRHFIKYITKVVYLFLKEQEAKAA